ncbi:MAG: glycosyltransferase [Chitinispirillaceae bacterium]|nr:glycosyltransferase [Chitinispirillaceae bacterium]
MTLHTLLGSNALTWLLFWAAIAVVSADFLATLVTVLYQRYWYQNKLRPKFPPDYTPRCTIIVPCKGSNKNLRSNLESFFALDHPCYSVVFVTESADDPAVPVIRETIRGRPNGVFVSAGISMACAQKNQNLLKGVDRASKLGSEIYVFADSDVAPARSWLREIIRPLADPRIVVTSGFRWLNAKKGSVAEWTHTYANIFIYIVFSCAFFVGGVGLWGGSMAMRRDDFEKLGVAKKWATAVVDDMSLSQIVHKNRLKGVIVSSCIAHTDELLSSVRASVAWFERQIMFLKVYFKYLWFFFALPIVIASTALLLLLPAAILLSLSETKTFFGAGGGAALVFYLGELITVSFYPLLGPMPRFHRFLLFQPFIRLTHAVSFIGTCMTNTITWSGVRYRLRFFGDVRKVERPENL